MRQEQECRLIKDATFNINSNAAKGNRASESLVLANKAIVHLAETIRKQNQCECLVKTFFFCSGYAGKGLEPHVGVYCYLGIHWRYLPSLPVPVTTVSTNKKQGNLQKQHIQNFFFSVVGGRLKPPRTFFATCMPVADSPSVSAWWNRCYSDNE